MGVRLTVNLHYLLKSELLNIKRYVINKSLAGARGSQLGRRKRWHLIPAVDIPRKSERRLGIFFFPSRFYSVDLVFSAAVQAGCPPSLGDASVK